MCRSTYLYLLVYIELFGCVINLVAERLSAGHMIRHYGLIERV